MRTFPIVVALVSAIACGAAEAVAPPTSTPSVEGTWALKTYNGGTLPYTGSLNANGSTNRVTSGSITLARSPDGRRTYLLDIRITNTLGSTQTPQDFAEVGSYSGDASAGLVLRPNDLSGGTGGGVPSAQVPATVSNNTLSFSQQGKILTFAKQ
jgi:hypothetical protein